MHVCSLQNEWVVYFVSVEREWRLCFLEMCVCCLQEWMGCVLCFCRERMETVFFGDVCLLFIEWMGCVLCFCREKMETVFFCGDVCLLLFAEWMGCVLCLCREKMEIECVSAPKDLQQHMSLNKKHKSSLLLLLLRWELEQERNVRRLVNTHHPITKELRAFVLFPGYPFEEEGFFARMPAWWLCLLCVCLFLWRNWNEGVRGAIGFDSDGCSEITQ